MPRRVRSVQRSHNQRGQAERALLVIKLGREQPLNGVDLERGHHIREQEPLEAHVQLIEQKVGRIDVVENLIGELDERADEALRVKNSKKLY